jgi:heavy metal sensor kinase
VFDPGHFAGVPLEAAHIVNGQPRFAYAVLADDTPIRLYTLPFTFRTQETGLLQVAESYQYIVEVQEQLIFLLAISLPFVLLVASGGGWFLASRALTPIDHITRSAQRISADDLHQRLNLQLPNDEVGRLAATFDQMLGRLEAAFDRQKRFIADASHEIRTPLTILKGDVEVALYRPRSIPEYQETLVMVNQTADRLNALVEELLLLARADNNQYPLQIKSIDLATLLQQEVAHLQSKATSKNITLTLETPATLPMLADPAKLSRLFINLIDNALKYSDPGSQVRVTASPKNQQIRVTIADTGPGIPAAHLPHLFDRFYRVDQARARQEANTTVSSGAGLGLSIAQWLAQIHGGRIEVASKVGTGTTFTVWLPLEPPQA